MFAPSVRAQTPGRRIDERRAFSRVGLHSGGGREVRDDRSFHVDDDDARVSPDVVDPVPFPVGSGHPGDELQAIFGVREDLDPPLLAVRRPVVVRFDDLTVVKGRAGGVIHGGCSAHGVVLLWA
jgi:hypothetical protein